MSRKADVERKEIVRGLRNLLPYLKDWNAWQREIARLERNVVKLLAKAALAQCNPTISRSIKTAITENPCCNQGNDLMHEAILGTQIPLPIHNATTTNVTAYWPNSSGDTILYENHNGNGILSPSSCSSSASSKVTRCVIGFSLHESARFDFNSVFQTCHTLG